MRHARLTVEQGPTLAVGRELSQKPASCFVCSKSQRDVASKWASSPDQARTPVYSEGERQLARDDL